METITVGSLAYLDTFAGMVPCKVVTVREEWVGRLVDTKNRVRIKVTAQRSGYRLNELVDVAADHVIPRPCVYRRNGQLRINTHYVITA